MAQGNFDQYPDPISKGSTLVLDTYGIDNFSRRYEKKLKCICDQLYYSLDAQPGIQILK